VLNDFRFGFNRANSSVEALKIAEGSAFAAQNGCNSARDRFPSVNWTSSGAPSALRTSPASAVPAPT